MVEEIDRNSCTHLTLLTGEEGALKLKGCGQMMNGCGLTDWHAAPSSIGPQISRHSRQPCLRQVWSLSYQMEVHLLVRLILCHEEQYKVLQPQPVSHGNRRMSIRESWAGDKAEVSGDCGGTQSQEWCSHLHRGMEVAESQWTAVAGAAGSEEHPAVVFYLVGGSAA